MRILILIIFFTANAACLEEPLGRPGRWVPAEVRAYTAFNKIDSGHKYNDGITAPPSSINLRRTTDPNEIYGIAADPRYLPHGSEVYVPGYYEMLQRNRRTIPTRMITVNDTVGGKGKRRQRQLAGRAFYMEVRLLKEPNAREWGINNGRGRGTLMWVYVYDRSRR